MGEETRGIIKSKSINIGSINFIDVIEHPSVNVWAEQLISNSQDEFIRLFCDNNIERLMKLIGEHLPEIPRSLNKNWGKCWKIHKNHLTWLVFSGNEGTIFLVETSLTQDEFKREASTGMAIVKFLNYLLEKLCCNE